MTTFAQTPDGYLWLGTLGGLVRFDGAAFTVYDRESTQGLTSSIIRALHADRAGMLWVGTENGGLSRFDGSASPPLPAPRACLPTPSSPSPRTATERSGSAREAASFAWPADAS